jgi:hypothetical protein
MVVFENLPLVAYRKLYSNTLFHLFIRHEQSSRDCVYLYYIPMSSLDRICIVPA